MDTKKRLNLWGPFLVVAAALVMLAVSTGAVDAARGGKGGGHGKPGGETPPSTATCVATPNPVTIWEVVTISGSGFGANASVGYVIQDAGGTHAGWVITDATGNFSKSYQTARLGTTTAEFSGGGAYATCSFQVV